MATGLDSQLAKARGAEGRGDFPAAAAIYNELLARYPGNVRARGALAALKQRAADLSGPHVHEAFARVCALMDEGRLEEALEAGEALATEHSGQPAVHNINGAILLRLRRPADAEAAFRRAIALEPEVALGYNNLGNAVRDQKRPEEAEALYRKSIEMAQVNPDAWNNLGTVLQDQGRLDEALAAYETALLLKPDLLDALNNRGSALHMQKRNAEAEAAFRAVIERKPDYGQVHANLAESLLAQERLEEGLAMAQRCVALAPDYAEGWSTLGKALRASGEVAEALAAFEQAVRLHPDNAPILNELGSMYLTQNEPWRALMILDLALEVDPKSVDVRNNRGSALRDMGRLAEAETAYREALEDYPETAQVWANLGVTLQEMGRAEEAIAAYGRALELDPALAECRMQRLYQRAQLCDWSQMGMLAEEMALLDGGKQKPSALPSLAIVDDPEVQLRRSVGMAWIWQGQPSATMPEHGPSEDGRIRIGYFSGDVHDHAIMYLASGLFREHDKSRFEVFVYSTGAVRGGVMRDRLIASVEHFHDVLEMSEQQLFELVRSHRLDVAIDVSGYTKGNRTGLFSRRLAPVQVNYLGYPGTLAAPFMDYAVVDPVLVPAEERPFMAERLMVMPHCYQPNDNTRPIAATPTTRADFSLPGDAFVFCCFNQGFKITPREFDIWMRLLREVPGSVLWLLSRSETVRANLRREAEARGIAGERLIFAEQAPQGEHLARHRHADLFLDTFAYNAHTTMSDALWAGLPAVTRIGRQFAARVGASLLTATGMAELIAASDAEYEALALALARDPARLAAIRAKLAAQVPSAPLFDTIGYTRALERGFELALERQRAGLPPADLQIPA